MLNWQVDWYAEFKNFNRPVNTNIIHKIILSIINSLRQ